MPEHHTSEYAYFFEHLAPEGFEGPSSSPNHSVAFDKRRQQLAGSPVQHAGVLEPEDEPEEDVVPWIGDLWDDELSHSEQGSDPLTADLLDDEDVAGFTESDVEDFDVSSQACAGIRSLAYITELKNLGHLSTFTLLAHLR